MAAVRWLIAGVWLGVQPWLRWPSLSSDVSHRLTLLVCCVAMWCWAMRRSRVFVVPQSWVAWTAVLLTLLAWTFRDVWRDGAYFNAFTETAALSHGVATVLTLLAGLWAWCQWSAADLRTLRWVGLAVLEINLLVALAQWWTGTAHVTGVMGIDRGLASYAVAWLPICWVWHPFLIALPLALLLLAHKPLALVAAVIALWRFCSWTVRGGLLLACGGGLLLMHPASTLIGRLMSRWDTWGHAWQASWEHPVVGWGFSPMVLSGVMAKYGYLLPSLHSDWLMLAVGAGWGLTLWALWEVAKVVDAVPTTRWAEALQGSLLGVAALSAVQSTLSHARIAGLMLFLLAWWVVEQREGARDA